MIKIRSRHHIMDSAHSNLTGGHGKPFCWHPTVCHLVLNDCGGHSRQMPKAGHLGGVVPSNDRKFRGFRLPNGEHAGI